MDLNFYLLDVKLMTLNIGEVLWKKNNVSNSYIEYE